MKWKLSVVRPCDMFWMGVTSNFELDMSTMIANDKHVWMVSEEGTCFEHCRRAFRPPMLWQPMSSMSAPALNCLDESCVTKVPRNKCLAEFDPS
jgi:hypothetical protein